MRALPEDAEKKLSNVEQVKAVENEAGKLAREQSKYSSLINQYKDKRLKQQEVERKIYGVANDVMKEHAEKLKAAQQRLAVMKSEATKIKNVKGIFNKRSDELEGKKTYKRLVPAVNWQVFNKDFVSIEFGLQVGYRVSPRLTMGLGYVHRWGFSESFTNFVKDTQTYGGRAYADLAVMKNFFVHGEFESMHIGPLLNATLSETDTNPVLGSYFGVGKRLKISRHLRGTVLGLYRVNYKAEIPDMHKFNMRVGVEYVFRKKKKKLV